MGAVNHSVILESVDLKEYLIKDMDNPEQIRIVDILLAYHRELNRTLPLHQRQIAKANYVYRKRCLK